MARNIRSKRRVPQAPAHPPSSRLGRMAQVFLVIIAVPIAVAVLGSTAVGTVDRPSRHMMARNGAALASEAPTLVPLDTGVALTQQQVDYGWYEQVLADAVGGDAHGEMLAAFFREHAFFSRLIGRGVTQSAFEGATHPWVDDSLAFEVTPASIEDRARNGLRVNSPWEWQTMRNELFVPHQGTFTNLWAGVVFAHELSHAHDSVSGTEPRGLPADDPRFLDGEIRAYEMEFRLLDLRTGGRWRSFVEEVLERRAGVAGADEWPMPHRDDLRTLDAIPTASLSRDEEDIRGGALTVSMNFLLNERRGGGIEGRRDLMRHLTY